MKKHWLIVMAFSLVWAGRAPISAQAFEPEVNGDIEVVGFSGEEPTTVWFRPVAFVDDVFEWNWSFGASFNEEEVVSHDYPGPGTYPVSLTMVSALSGVIIVEREVTISSDDLVIKDGFEDLALSSEVWFPLAGCEPDYDPGNTSYYLKFPRPLACSDPGFVGEKVDGDVLCLGPTGGPGIVEPPSITLNEDETAAFIRLKFNIKDLDLEDGAAFDLLILDKDPDGSNIARLEFRRLKEYYIATLHASENGPWARASSSVPLSSGSGETTLVLDWIAASQPGELDGYMKASFWFDSTPGFAPPDSEISLVDLNNSGMSFNHLRIGLYDVRRQTVGNLIPPDGHIVIKEVEMRRENPVFPFSD